MSERAGQEVRLRSVPFDGSSCGRLARAPACGGTLSTRRRPCPEPRTAREYDSASRDCGAGERIFCEKCRAIEVRMIQERSELSDRGNPKARFDHAACHHSHSEGARSMNDLQCLSKAA